MSFSCTSSTYKFYTRNAWIVRMSFGIVFHDGKGYGRRRF